MKDKLETIVTRLYEVSEKHKTLRWKFGGELRRPTKGEIRSIVKSMLENLDREEQISSGGIIIKYDGHHKDVYIHLGELE